MFRRLKQNFKEKTGQAQKTPLPDDVETNIEYTNQIRQRAEKVQKAIEHLIHKWKGSGMNVQEHIAEPLGILSAKAGTGLFADRMKAVYDLHNDLGRIERRTYDAINKRFLEDVFQYFLKHDNAQAVEAVKQLNKRRLDRDSFASEVLSKPTPERQQRADAAEVELASAITYSREHFAKFGEQQRVHTVALKQMLEVLSNHFMECHLATKNTMSFIEVDG